MALKHPSTRRGGTSPRARSGESPRQKNRGLMKFIKRTQCSWLVMTAPTTEAMERAKCRQTTEMYRSYCNEIILLVHHEIQRIRMISPQKTPPTAQRCVIFYLKLSFVGFKNSIFFAITCAFNQSIQSGSTGALRLGTYENIMRLIWLGPC